MSPRALKIIPSFVMRVRIELREIRPKIYRTVDVVGSTRLTEFHDIIQHAFNWEDYHLWKFEIDGTQYGIPFEYDDYGHHLVHSNSITIDEIFASNIEQFTYVYDFGDHWVHDIRFDKPQKQVAGVSYPVLVEGRRRTPPEDVGSVPGYYEFVEIINDPTHEDHKEMKRWSGPYDPEEMNTLLQFLEHEGLDKDKT